MFSYADPDEKELEPVIYEPDEEPDPIDIPIQEPEEVPV